ncbi:MAG TPA: hypothetical protein VGF67_05000 [Ktedonobacteraceae bacterium]
MTIRRSCQLRWYKKVAQAGTWSTYVQAANEEEVRWMHKYDLTSVARFAERYAGPYTVEILPPDFIPPHKTWQECNEEAQTGHKQG